MAIRSFFMLMRKANGVYEKYCQEVIREWGINNTSFQVVMFLANNPEFNTARDLCRLRGMKTGIVSVAVDQLCRAELLERRPDPEDRRIQRLHLTAKSDRLVEDGHAVQRRFFQQISRAMTEEEFARYMEMTMKLKNTIEEMDANA